MSDAILVALISALISLVGIFVSSKSTRDALTHKLDTNQRVLDNEMGHIKAEMLEMKESIKSHNQYAKLFNENVPVIKEKLSAASHRIDDLERDVRELQHRT